MNELSLSVTQGDGHIRHNNRDIITENIDQDRMKDNIYYKQEDIKDAYEHLFNNALEEYNSKQKRKDRKIDNYYEHIEKSKQENTFYEVVVQVGNKFSANVGSENGIKAKDILNEYMESFQERNPNLYVFNAVLHLDEATPHLHIDYIPIATKGFKNGLSTRNSLDKAFIEQGISKGNKSFTTTQNWWNREKDYIETLMNKRAIERLPDSGLDNEHLTVKQYKACANLVKNEVEVMPDVIEPIQSEKSLKKGYRLVKEEDLNTLNETVAFVNKKAKLCTIHENSTKIIKDKIEEDYENTYHNLSIRENNSLKNEQKSIKKLAELDIKLEEVELEKEELTLQKTLYEEKYKEQEEINVICEELKENNEHLQKQLDYVIAEKEEVVEDFKNKLEQYNIKYKALEDSIDDKVHQAQQIILSRTTPTISSLKQQNNELRAENNFLKSAIQELLKPIKFIIDNVVGKLGRFFLNSILKTAKKIINYEDDVIPELTNDFYNNARGELLFNKKSGTVFIDDIEVDCIKFESLRQARNHFEFCDIKYDKQSRDKSSR